MSLGSNATDSRLWNYFQLISERRRMVLAVAITAFVFGITLSFLLPKTYLARAAVEISDPERGTKTWSRAAFSREFHSRHCYTELAVISGQQNLYRTIDRLKLATRWGKKTRQQALPVLHGITKIRLRAHTRIIDIEVQAPNPEEAIEIANAIAASYVEEKKRKKKEHSQAIFLSLRDELGRQQERVQELEAELAVVSGERANPGNEFSPGKLKKAIHRENGILLLLAEHFKTARVKNPGAATRIHEFAESATRRTLLTAWILLPAVGSLLLFTGFGLALWIGKRAVRNGDSLRNIEKNLNTGPVTLVPIDAGILISDRPPYGHRAEPYRDLRTRFERRCVDELSRIVCVVAPERGEGGAETAVNLSSVFADGGHTVLLIDADMRQPSLHEVFHAAYHPGLSDYLSGEMRIEETVVKAAYPNLWFIPSGPKRVDPCHLFTSRRMDDLVIDMKSRFDFIFVHSPAMEECSDATALVGSADDTLLVAIHRKHKQYELMRAKNRIEAAGGNFAGLLLTGVEKARTDRKNSVRM